MSEAVATIPAKGMSKKTKKILIIVFVILLLIGAVVLYLMYDKKQQLKGLPTTSDNLKPGDKWNNNGVLTTVI